MGRGDENILNNPSLTPRSQSPRFNTIPHLNHQPLQPLQRRTPNLPVSLRIRRNHISRFGRIEKSAVHALIRLHLLPQDRRVVVRCHQCIQRVDPLPWVSAGVRAFADEFAVDFFARVH